MKKFVKYSLISLFVSMCSIPFLQAQEITFEPQASLLGTNTYKNGAGRTVSVVWLSDSVKFYNAYNTDFGGYWQSGWAFSRVNNTTQPGFGNMYAAIAGAGAGTYAVGQNFSSISFTGIQTITGLTYTNTSYAYWSMKNGDSFARSFSGANNDFFKLTIKPIYPTNHTSSATVEVYLADFLTVNGVNTILNTWKTIDLTTLGGVLGLTFELSSSDNGLYGMNTPAFFCIKSITGTRGLLTDFRNITFPGTENYVDRNEKTLHNVLQIGNFLFLNKYQVRQPSDYWAEGFALSKINNATLSGSLAIYASAAGAGINGSTVYGLIQKRLITAFTAPQSLSGMYVTNTSYSYASMKFGDANFSKMGGVTGTSPDFFRVVAKGYSNGTLKPDSAVIYLADFRDSNSQNRFISNTWRWFSLTSLGVIDSLLVTVQSSDVETNPLIHRRYIAIDNFNGTAPLPITSQSQNNLATTNQWLLYPNPATGTTYLCNLTPESLNFRMFDLSGKIIYTGEIPSEQTYILDISTLEKGMYIIQSSDGSVKRLFVCEGYY